MAIYAQSDGLYCGWFSMASNAFVRAAGPVGEVPGAELVDVDLLLGAALVFALPHALTASTSKARRAVPRLICTSFHIFARRLSAVAARASHRAAGRPAGACGDLDPAASRPSRW